MSTDPSNTQFGESPLVHLDAMVASGEFKPLLRELAMAFGRLVPSEFFALHLYDPRKNRMMVYAARTSGQEEAVIDTGVPMETAPAGFIMKTQKALVVDDWQDEPRWPQAREILESYSVRSSVMLPLTTARCKLGTIGFYSLKPAVFSPPGVEFLSQLSVSVALAVENVLNCERLRLLQGDLSSQRDHLQLLLDLSNDAVMSLNPPEMFKRVSDRMREVLDHQLASLAVWEQDGLVLRAYDAGQIPGPVPLGTRMPLDSTVSGRAWKSRRMVVVQGGELDSFESPQTRAFAKAGLQSVCAVPLQVGERMLGIYCLGTLRENAFTPKLQETVQQVANQLAIALNNALSFQQLEAMKNKLNQENLYLQDEVRSEAGFDEIIGTCQAIQTVLERVRVVATTDATVLICGETGTGKELIARAIHQNSGRSQHPFIKVNCAAIPAALLESEFFGHEKGAYTGAHAQRIGRFELADEGTLFLDEVGDTPLEIQAKLLRVLQDQEFERLGGTRTIRTNVRVVAATNRDLEEMVHAREFRSDLYYRLNVFPVRVPSLSERRDDIPALVKHFAQRSAMRLNRQIQSIPTDAIEAMMQYPWPGNLRELQNFVERAVILSRGPALELPVGELTPRANASEASGMAARIIAESTNSLDTVQREHITRVLKEARWVIGGKTGAAAKLGMKRTTLQSKMRKLGITKP